MATPQQFARDWVYRVVQPFLTQFKNRLGNIKLEKTGSNIVFTNPDAISNTVPVGKETFSYSNLGQHDNDPDIEFLTVDDDYVTLTGNTMTFKKDSIISFTLVDGFEERVHTETPLYLELHPVNGYLDTFGFRENGHHRLFRQYQFMYFHNSWISVEFYFKNIFVKANQPIEIRSNASVLKDIFSGGFDGKSNYSRLSVKGVVI